MNQEASPTRPVDNVHQLHTVAGAIMAVIFRETDTPTTSCWANCQAVSVPVLRTRCSMAGASAKRCLDLGRLLRVRRIGPTTRREVFNILDTHDPRTADSLFERAGQPAFDSLH